MKTYIAISVSILIAGLCLYLGYGIYVGGYKADSKEDCQKAVAEYLKLDLEHGTPEIKLAEANAQNTCLNIGEEGKMILKAAGVSE